MQLQVNNKKSDTIDVAIQPKVSGQISRPREGLWIYLIIFHIIGCFFIYMRINETSEPYRTTLLDSFTRMRVDDEVCLAGRDRFTPEQLHLSLGKDSQELYVTWSTIDQVLETKLVYREVSMNRPRRFSNIPDKEQTAHLKITDANVTLSWTSDTGEKRRILYNYRAKMVGLRPHHRYAYRVESRALAKGGPDCKSFVLRDYYSNTYTFVANNLTDPNAHVRVAMFGDLGLKNGQSTRSLINDVDESRFDLVIHNGDFAYDLNTDGGEVGDRFMRVIEPIAARVPYQTSVGNHEIAENFTFYDSRFTMINTGKVDYGEHNNFFYSFNVGPIHFVGISTEFYYFLDSVGLAPLARQYNWLVEDLKQASSPAERAIRPWIVVFGHRPMYCSSRDEDDCTKDTNLLRKGLPFTGSYALEKMFYEFGVDLELYAHEHQYERFLPLYDAKIYNGSENHNDPYFNPRAPVHLISGAAGNQENLDPFKGQPAVGSIKQITAYGYTIMSASRCQLSFVQKSSDSYQKELDSFKITKTRLVSFPSESPINLECNARRADE